MTDHPLTPERIVTFREEHVDSYAYAQAIFDAGREHERTTTEGARPWEPLSGPVRVGDEVRREFNGITATAVVGRVDEAGDPWAAEGGFIGVLEHGTWYVRRAVQELPTEDGAVIVPADGYEAIDATWDGFGWLASEAVLDADGKWHGVWRRELGRGVIGSVGPECITTRTCKVSDQ